MMRKKLNSEGFTMVELLAIIVILGILLLIAIPRVTGTITDSRKEAFVDTALAFISSAKNAMVNDSYTKPIPIDPGYSVCIPFSEIEYEKGSKSPFGSSIDTKASYVKIYNDHEIIRYYVYMRDKKDHYLGPIEESVFSKYDGGSAKKTDLVYNKNVFYTEGKKFLSDSKSDRFTIEKRPGQLSYTGDTYQFNFSDSIINEFTIDNKKGSFRDLVLMVAGMGDYDDRIDPAGVCTYLFDTEEKTSNIMESFKIYDAKSDYLVAYDEHETEEESDRVQVLGYSGNSMINTVEAIFTYVQSKKTGAAIPEGITFSNDSTPYKTKNYFDDYIKFQVPAKLKEGVSGNESEGDEDD